MKRFLQTTLALLLLALALYLAGILLAPLVKEALAPYFPLLGDNQTADDTVSVTVLSYKQDPESGLYVEAQKKTLTFPAKEAVEITPESFEHYLLNEEKSTLFSSSATNGAVFNLFYDCKSCLVTFDIGQDATVVKGSMTQNLRRGQTPNAPELKKEGYTLNGYDQALEPVYEDTVYTAQWELTRYTLRLHTVKGSTLDSMIFTERADAPGCFETSFSYFDSLPLPTATCPDADFLSWNTAADGSGKTVTALTAGQSEDLYLYAIINRKIHSITFVSPDSVSYPTVMAYAGDKIASPKIPAASQKPGMGLNWYTDEACTNLYTFSLMPAENLTLYGKWVKDTGTGFLDWDVDKKTIDTPDELIAFMDYIRFYELESRFEMEVTYAGARDVMQDLAEAAEAWEFRAGGTFVYTAETKSVYQNKNARCVVIAYVENGYRDSEASLSMPATGKTTYTYPLADKTVGRGSTNTAFYIDGLTNSFPVSTTNQLLYVVEHGYRPLPQRGSDAERIYAAARALLNDILPENATDYDKALAIFRYLVTEIEYDMTAANASQNPNFEWALYDAYHLEGVFDKKKAVCDGIAKAFSLLCNIEGIPCVEVSGNSHAWNRVKIYNQWYVVDATFGRLHLDNYAQAAVDHGQFLISDAEKAATGYLSKSYSAIHALSSFHYFAYESVVYEGKTMDFVIENSEELADFLALLLEKSPSLDRVCADFQNEIEALTFYQAYDQALAILKQGGIEIGEECFAFSSTYGAVTKLVFLSK